MQLMTLFAMLTAAAGVLFALQNRETVTVSLFAWSFDASLAIVLLLALAIGGVIVALVSTPSTLRRQWTIVRQQKRINELEQRLDQLQQEAAGLRRHLPATEEVGDSPYKEMPGLIASDAGDSQSAKG